MDTLQAIASRKSVRQYSDRAVEAEKLEKILATGNKAPNAGPFQMTIVEDKTFLKQINDTALEAMKNSGNEFLMSRAALPGYRPLYGAPVLVVLSAPPGPYAQTNTACAATNLCLAATELGLGSCFVITPTFALTEGSELLSKLSLPPDFIPQCCVLLGYHGGDAYQTERAVPDNINYVR